MRMQILVDAGEFWPRLQGDIRSASDYVYLQTLSFEGDRVGHEVADSLIASRAADRRIVADHFYSHYRLNDKFVYNPRHFFDSHLRRERTRTIRLFRHLESEGVPVRLVNQTRPPFVEVLRRNHKKIIVIDDRIAYIGGFNFSEHNFEWHDMMLRIEDEAVTRFLKDDFLSTWSGKSKNSSRRSGDISIFRFDGRTNERAFGPILDLVGGARSSIFVESAYITYPFFDRLRAARRNGASVTLVIPDNNNWRMFKEYGLWEAEKSGIDLRLYGPRMSHLKAMLIDDEYLVVGSSNFDLFSCYFMEEIVGVVTNAHTIAQFREKVLESDLASSSKFVGSINTLKGRYHDFRLRAMKRLFSAVYNGSGNGG